MYQLQRRMSARPVRMSLGRGRKVRAGLAKGRGSLAAARSFDAESAFPGQVLENPVEGSAIRLVAEGFAYVVARERLGQALERRADVGVHFGGAPTPGPVRRREVFRLRRSLCVLLGLDHP